MIARFFLVLVTCILGFVFSCTGAALAQTITPEPIALGPGEFPLPKAVLDQQIAADNTAALREHAWILWSGVTADSTQSFQGQKLPIWETWLSEQEAFAFSTGPVLTQARAAESRNLRPFAIPRQFRHQSQRAGNLLSLQVTPNAAKTRLLAFVKLSPDSASFVAVSHPTPGPGGPDAAYNKTSDLDRLNAFFDRNATPVIDRKIVDFPAAATDLKMVFVAIKADQLSAVPLWAGPQNSTNAVNPTPDTWNQCVAVDPSNSKSGTTQIDCNGKTVTAEIVPLTRFYAIQVDPETASRINATLNLSGAASIAGGDFQILLAMHVTTKEITNWTWQTFWWQNGQNPPGKIPGSVDGMLGPDRIKGPWRNYAMCISDSIVFPPNDPKGKPIVCYNPFLETAQDAGIDSNCMSCHARATYQGAPYPSTYIPNGWVDLADPAIFGGQVKTDFVWAIPGAAH
jgi:hypothetical protein